MAKRVNAVSSVSSDRRLQVVQGAEAGRRSRKRAFTEDRESLSSASCCDSQPKTRKKSVSAADRWLNKLTVQEKDKCFCTASNIRLCTSGYSYKHWHEDGSFYENVPATAEFYKYSAIFDTVELNATFYGWFKEETFDKWRERASEVRSSFRYIIKASSLYTHKKRLNVDAYFIDSWHRFWNRCQRLDKHLGPVLFQLPENFALHPHAETHGSLKKSTKESNLTRLKALGSLLPRDGHFVFEFRH